VVHHGDMAGVTLYDGPIAALLAQSGRKTLLQALACEFLTDKAA